MYAEIREKIKVKNVEIKPPFILGGLTWPIMSEFTIRCKGFFVMKSRDHTITPIPRSGGVGCPI
jgi:hypothetical protein